MLKSQTMTYPQRRAGASGGAGRLLGLLAGAMSLALVLSGCSGCSEEEAPCAGVVCELGECNASSGQCVNPAACGEDSPACLEGFSCDAQEARCVADIPCADNVPCERGLCRAGACVDPPSCESDASCVPTSYCDLSNGTCAPDPCSNGLVSCERGVCDRIAGACVNEDVCTTQNEDTTCLEGFRCFERACVSVQARCDELNCQRGVCSFELNICDDAPTCESDRDCLASRYCGEDNTCQANVCNGVDQECARGVCEASTGECVNPPSCTASAQCVDDNLCVSDVCVPRAQACGEDGCPGSQTCNYDPATRVAQCGEAPSGACTASLDCADDRICRAGRCQAPVACEPDALEPNDDPSAATSYDDASGAAGVTASLCSGDVDLFTFDTADSPNTTGRLIVNITINPEDRGLGALSLELLSPSGDVLAQATTDARGRANVGQDVSDANQGVYTIRVTDSGDVRQSGARYNVFAKVADSAVVQACSAPRALMQGQPVFARTTSGASASLGASCVDTSGVVPEDIYTITIAQRALVTLTLTPESSADLGLSLRADCLSDGSEIAGACADVGGDGGVEEINTLLEPGTYFAVVQADLAADGGFYELALRVNPTICSARDNACVDENTARVCNERGTDFDEISCSNGCDALTGACNAPVGDSCAAPRALMLDTPQSLFIDWNSYNNSYDPGPGGCVPSSGAGSPTAGPDVAFTLEVPAQTALVASLSDTGRDVAMYVVTDCDDLANTCLAAANDGSATNESLTWLNDSDQPVSVVLIVDVEPGDSYVSSQLLVEARTACTPGEVLGCSADGASLRACNRAGFAETLACDAAGCMNDACVNPGGRACFDAITLSGQAGSEVGGWTGGDNLQLDAGRYHGQCVVPGGLATVGADTFYQIALQAGELFEASLVTSRTSAYLMLFEDCEDTETCVANNPRRGATTLRYYAEQPVTLTVVVDSSESASSTLDYTLNWNVSTGLSCAPGQTRCLDAMTMVVCDDDGMASSQVVCAGGCEGRGCQLDPVTSNSCADVLADPADIGDGITLYGDLADLTSSLSFTTATSCAGRVASPGPDAFLKVVLDADEVLEVRAEMFGAARPLLYIITDCSATAASCVAGVAGSTTTYTGQAFYLNETDMAQTLLVGLDSTSAMSAGLFALSVGKGAPECTPGDRQCDATGQNAQVCNSFGRFEQSACDYGCMSGECLLPPGEVCSDAIAITPGVPTQGDLADYSADHTRPGSSCPNSGSGASSGKDVVYKVMAQENDIIDVTLDSAVDTVITISGSCDAATDELGACLAGRDGGNPERLTFVAPAAGEYFIVASAYSASSPGGPFTITVTVEAPQCVPNTRLGCLPDGDTLEVCSPIGVPAEVSCANGCMNDRCVLPEGDVCSDAIALTSGTPVQGDIAMYGIHHTRTSAACPTSNSGAPAGKDIVYTVSALAGDVIDVTLDSSFNGVITISGSCDAATDRLGACLAGRDDGNPERLGFEAPADGDYFITVSAASSFTSTGTFTLTASVYMPTCAPNTRLGCLPDGDTLEVCDPFGLPMEVDCAFGCVNDRCVLPEGDVCSDAIALTSGVAKLGDLSAGYSINHTRGTCPNSGSGSSSGKDIVYTVAALAGDIIDIRLNAAFDGVLTIADSCDAATDELGACLAGRDGGNPERLTFVAPAAGEYFIVASAYSASEEGGPFSITATVTTPICAPNTVLGCLPDGDTLEVCDAMGVPAEVACDNGCVNDACALPAGDVCTDAIVLTSGVPYSGNTTDYNEDYSEQGDDCLPLGSSGVDTVFVISAQANQDITVTYQSSFDGVLWLTDSCSDTGALNMCLDGVDGGVSNATETLVFTAPQTGDYYIVGAAYSSSGSGTFTVTATVQ